MYSRSVQLMIPSLYRNTAVGVSMVYLCGIPFHLRSFLIGCYWEGSKNAATSEGLGRALATGAVVRKRAPRGTQAGSSVLARVEGASKVAGINKEKERAQGGGSIAEMGARARCGVLALLVVLCAAKATAYATLSKAYFVGSERSVMWSRACLSGVRRRCLVGPSETVLLISAPCETRTSERRVQVHVSLRHPSNRRNPCGLH